MKNRKGRWIQLALIVLLLPVIILLYEWVSNRQEVITLKADSGTLDGRNITFSNDQLIAMDGHWLVHNINTNRQGLEPLMHRWIHGEKGLKEYTLMLYLPASENGWGIAVGNILSSSRLSVNGRELGSSGRPAATVARTIERNKPYYVYFPASSIASNHKLTLEVANFTVDRAGVRNALLLGSDLAIRRMESNERAEDYVIVAVAAFFCLFNLSMFVQRRSDLSFIYFSLICIALMLHTAHFSQRLLYEWFPFVTFDTVGKLHFFNSLMLVFFVRFYQNILADVWLKRLSPWFDRIALLLLPIFLFVPYSILIRFDIVISVLILFVFVLLLFVSIRALLRGLEVAYLIVLGFALPVYISLKLVLSLMFGLFSNQDVVSVNPLIIPLFILTQALVMARKQRLQEEQIMKSAEELREVNRKKEQFLVRMAHDLSNPLQAITNLSLALAERHWELTEATDREDLQAIHRTSSRLAWLVNEIIDIERIKSGTIILQKQTVDLYAAVRSVSELVPFIKSQSMTMVRIDFSAHHWYVNMDANRLQQVLFNVMECVQRHLHEGVLQISVSMRDEEWLELVIKGQDNGSFAFEKKCATQPSFEHEIGLLISEELMAVHGGQLFVQHVSDSAVPVIRLLCLRAYPSFVDQDNIETSSLLTATSHQQQTPNQPIARGTVLVMVGASADLQGLYRLLENDGLCVLFLPSNIQIDNVMEFITKNEVELCILDTFMTQMNGFELCRHLRSRYHHAQLPVLLLTGKHLEGIRESAYAAGANDVVEQPYHTLDLRARVQTLIHMKRTANLLTQSEIAFLRAQIKPHFLYNALNTLMWSAMNDVEQTKHLIFHLSNVLRSAYHFDTLANAIDFTEELSVIQSYLLIEKARFADRLEIVLEIETEQFAIPPFVLQPLIENALQHGILGRTKGGILRVGTRIVTDGVEVFVEDNGPGMDEHRFNQLISANLMETISLNYPQSRRGVGLPNVHMRLLRTTNHGLRMENVDPEGTRILFFIPTKR